MSSFKTGLITNTTDCNQETVSYDRRRRTQIGNPGAELIGDMVESFHIEAIAKRSGNDLKGSVGVTEFVKSAQEE